MGAIVAIIAGSVNGGEDVDEIFVLAKLLFVFFGFVFVLAFGDIVILVVEDVMIFGDKPLFDILNSTGEVASEATLVSVVDLIV